MPLNYAFLPAYPFAMRLVATPLTWLGMAPISAAAVAGVPCRSSRRWAPCSPCSTWPAAASGTRAASGRPYYLLIFPTGFFLAQVYTEALFLAASLGALACIADRRPFAAAGLSVLAVLTRPVGIALVLAVAVEFGALLLRRRDSDEELTRRGSRAGSPPSSVRSRRTLLWSWSDLGRALSWCSASTSAAERSTSWPPGMPGRPRSAALARRGPRPSYYVLEAAAVVLALIACGWAVRRWPAATAFGLATLVIAATSGAPQGMVRYVLAVPPLFLLLARLGEHPAFDRVWTVVSLLLMTLLATLYTFDFWVA